MGALWIWLGAALLRRGGFPALHAVRIGGTFDAWKVPPDPGGSHIGLMRYRSRRDMAALATASHHLVLIWDRC